MRPDPRPSTDHASHDRWLVVRWTTDIADLTPTETAQARALLASCADCAALAADIELISRATATSVVPPRPRDFRFTPEQALAARGGVGDRLRRWLGSPRSVALRPLAGAAMTVGLVLVLVAPSIRPSVSTTGDATSGGRDATVMMAPGGSPAAADAAATEGTQTAGATEAAAATQAAKATVAPDSRAGTGPEMFATAASGEPTTSGGPTTSGEPTATSEAPTGAGEASTGAGETPIPHGDAAMLAQMSPSPAPEADTAAVQDAGSPAPRAPDGAVPPAHDSDTTAGAAATTTDDTTFALTLLGIVLAAVGLIVLVLSLVARRWRDPLLR